MPQDYSKFGLEGVYDNVPQLYVYGNVDNEVILKLSEEGGEKLTWTDMVVVTTLVSQDVVSNLVQTQPQ